MVIWGTKPARLPPHGVGGPPRWHLVSPPGRPSKPGSSTSGPRRFRERSKSSSTSSGAHVLTVHVEPEALDAGTDCLDDLVGFPADLDLGELGDWPLTFRSRNEISEHVGSFTLQNLGEERCRFGLGDRAPSARSSMST